MTIGSPSGSGATTKDISDSLDSRWYNMFKSGLQVSQPNQLEAGGSGAAPTFETYGVKIFSGTSGDNGYIASGDFGNEQTIKQAADAELIKVSQGISSSISSIDDDIRIGYVTNPSSSPSIDEAVFYPTAGDNTSGNVRVRNGGTQTDGSISYANTDELNTYLVLIDTAGVYQTAGTTGFYINKDPRRGDDPDATISATPRAGNNGKFGIFYIAAGSSFDNQQIEYMEVSKLL